MNGPEVYATVFALGPGKTDANVLWAGSDDGLINVTRDGGRTWTNVTPKEMPDLGRVSIIDASVFDPGIAYVAVKKPLLNDMSPYIFRTHDFGRTWTKIVNGIDTKDYVHAVREDPTRRGLLYAGTEHGFYISYDDGDTWRSLSLNLPDTQVSDIWVEANDIAISTHGRGFYILDHVEPLRQWGPAVASADGFYLFKPEAAIRSGGNATLTYLLHRPVTALTIDILDSKGTIVQQIRGGAAPVGGTVGGGRGGGAGTGAGGGRGGRGGPAFAPMTTGLNTVTWNMRYPDATSFPGMILWGGSVAGPAAPPGTYQVRMTVDGKTQTQPLVVKRHPLHAASDADLVEQFNLAIQIRDKVSEANNAVIQIRNIKTQVGDRLSKSQDAKLKAAGDTLTKNLSAVEEEIYQVRNQASEDPLNFPIKINNRLATLLSIVNRGDGKPIGNAEPVFEDLIAELKVQTDRLQQVLTRDLAAFNAEAKRVNLDPVTEK
jgi:hypothetical protein